MMTPGLSLPKLYTILAEKMGEDVAEALVTYVREEISTQVEGKTTHLATKEDLANIKSDLIKWMVGIFITLVVMILGLYATVIFFFMQSVR